MSLKSISKALRMFINPYSIVLTVLLIIVYFLFQFVFKTHLLPGDVTWIYSSSMQTLAALIALLPISYGYYITNIDNEKNESLDSYIIERLKSDVYVDMMTVIVYSLIVIVVNLFSFFLQYQVSFALIIALLTVEGIGLISLYIYRLFDPNKVREILKEFDTSKDIDPNQQVISLDTFITKYLELETTVKDFISNENDNELVDTLPLYDIVDNLSKDFPQLQEHYDTFKEIIFHRNNLIHNYTETVVDYSKYTKIIELLDLFEKLNSMFIQRKVFGNVVKIKNTIDVCLKEYLSDRQNKQEEAGVVPEDMKEEIVSLLHSYFISDYYFTKSLDDASDADFEIIQNNYSERKLVGIDIKSINTRNVSAISKSYFSRLQNRFTYLFLINFEPKHNQFSVMYKTKDNELRTVVVK